MNFGSFGTSFGSFSSIGRKRFAGVFDGVGDEVNFGTHAIPASDSIEVVFKPEDDGNRGVLYSQGSLAGSFGFALCTSYTNTTSTNTNTINFRTRGTSTKSMNLTQDTCLADGTTYRITLDFNSSAGTISISLFNYNTGALIETVSETGLDANKFNTGASRPLKVGEDQAGFDDYTGKILSVKSSLIDANFQANFGTSTVVDNSGNGNNGTVTTGSGGLATFWGTV